MSGLLVVLVFCDLFIHPLILKHVLSINFESVLKLCTEFLLSSLLPSRRDLLLSSFPSFWTFLEMDLKGTEDAKGNNI